VVVVDNGSADGSAAMVRAEFPEAVLIASPVNESYARGTNRALEAATGDLLLLLNPDAEVTAGALDTLADFLDTRPDAAAVAPKLVSADGAVQGSVRGFPAPAAVLWDVLRLARVFPNVRAFGAYRLPRFDYGKTGEAPQPMASCFLISREAYAKVGGMDERFPLYFNDVDWCLRAYEAGYRIYYTPEAAVRHGYGGTTRRDEARRRVTVWESHRALLRLWDKHYKRKTAAPLLALMTGVVTLGAWARTGRWGESFGRGGGDTTPESLHRELERAGRPAGVPVQPAGRDGGAPERRDGGGG
jgi:GT2 family glycosyltransferase